MSANRSAGARAPRSSPVLDLATRLAPTIGLAVVEVLPKVSALRAARLVPTAAEWNELRGRGARDLVEALAFEHARTMLLGIAGSTEIRDTIPAVTRLAGLRAGDPSGAGGASLWLLLGAAMRGTEHVDTLLLAQRSASALVRATDGAITVFGTGVISGPSFTITGEALASIGVAVRECML